MAAETGLAVASVAGPGEMPAEPVFVLCGGRSGSTLLRFLLDAHPDLACPPETNVPAMAGQLATVWSLIEGAPLSAERGDEPPEIPDAAIRGVRRTMDEMTGSYLTRRGKKRYCDKSLGTARYAELLLRVYPQARFLCLYRHPMDVIASGLEACPWGLNGYGFDAYIASTPGNSLWALARFWTDNVAAILAAEDRFAGSCHRVRYEDMVTDPEGVASGIFGFLGVSAQPGISARCFAPERERFGPADYKIWHTSQISGDSLGRGWTLPVGMIPPPVREQMNQFTAQLGYIPVDDAWGTGAAPADLRLADSRPPAKAPTAAAALLAADAEIVGQRLRAGLAQADEAFTRRWGACSAETFSLIAIAPAGAGHDGDTQWRVDMTARTVTGSVAVAAEPEPWPTAQDAESGDGSADAEARDGAVDAAAAAAAAAAAGKNEAGDATGGSDANGSNAGGDDDTAWDVVGSLDAWRAVLSGRTNLGVAMRRCELRYCDTGEGGAVASDTRIAMLADLLGLKSSWQPSLDNRAGLNSGQ